MSEFTENMIIPEQTPVLPEPVTSEAPQTSVEGAPMERGRFQRVLNVGKRAVEGAVVVFVVSPTNELARVAATGAVAAATRDPWLAAATWGGTTLAIESAAGVVAADLLESEGGKKFVEKINDKAEKVGISRDTKFSPVTKAGISYMAGSAVATLVEHREDPTRTRAQNLRYGLLNASALGAVCTVQGALVAEGIATPNALTVGGAAIGVGSVVAAIKWASSRVRKSKVPEAESPEA